MQIELQKYYEQRFSMMSTQGWKDLVEDLEEMRKAVNDLNPVTTSDQLWFKKGELSIIDWVLNLKKTSEEVYDDLLEEQNASKNV